MIDLHSHVLPGIDDGAPNLETTRAMLDAYRTLGVRTVVATPHLVGALTADYAEQVDRAFAQVGSRARKRGISLERGFEIALAPDTADWLAKNDPASLAGSGTVLLDLPFTDWPLYADASLFAVQAAGYRVILAHPERYPGIQDDPGKAAELVDRGILMQVTIGSFMKVFGNRAKRSAEELLARGLVHILATDAHSAGHRLATVPAGLATLSTLLGKEQLQRATVETPASVLNGDPVPAPVQARPRSWQARLLDRVGL